MLTDEYIEYIRTVRRYSSRTRDIYREVLEGFAAFALPETPDQVGGDVSARAHGGDVSARAVGGDVSARADGGDVMAGSDRPSPDAALLAALKPAIIRNYEVYLLDERKADPRTVNLHLSVLSGFCRYLIHRELIPSNPVRLISRPKTSKRLPVFYREDSMRTYFKDTGHDVDAAALERLLTLAAHNPSDPTAVDLYERRLRRLIVALLYECGIRRSELITLTVGSVDFGRRTLSVHGKGDKMREIPLVAGLCEEISLYLQSVETMTGVQAAPGRALLLTAKGRPLYPVYVDRAVKQELGAVAGINGRKSPHVLRHTLATELLDNGTDLNSIKELLGHASLAATQVYTHNSIEKLKTVYQTAHPRAKRGGNNGH